MLWLFARKLELDAGVNSSLRAQTGKDGNRWSRAVSVAAGGGAARARLHKAAEPQRVVSTSPSITETLFALGLGDRVVGVSTFCRYPQAAAAEGRHLPRRADRTAPAGSGHRSCRSAHRAAAIVGAGIASITVDRGTLAGIYSSIRAMAPPPAWLIGPRLIAELEARLAAVQRGATRSSRKVPSSSAASRGRSI